jgi:tRNA(Ile)-lysidine synthase
MGPQPAVATIRRAVRDALLRVDGPVLVACSGGADSLALAAAVAFECTKDGRPAGAVTIDHGLQEGSTEQARRAAGLCYELGLDPVQLVEVEVARRAGGPENAARQARYEALNRVRGEARILLGHTRDDQAETVLLGLGRGSGPRSIAGMQLYDGHYVRPFLDIERATTVAACSALGLPFWDDPHNLEPRFRRVRLRREVLPLLEDVLGGGVAAALARTAGLLRSDLDALEEVAASVSAACVTAGRVDAVSLSRHPRAVRTRVLRSWAGGAGVGALMAVHMDALDDLVIDWHGQIGVDLPGGYRASRRSGRLHLHPPHEPAVG